MRENPYYGILYAVVTLTILRTVSITGLNVFFMSGRRGVVHICEVFWLKPVLYQQNGAHLI